MTGLDAPGSRSDAELSREMAQEAGRLLMEVRRTYGEAALLDPRTNRELRDDADREAHLLIERRLAQHRPGDTLLSEEGDGSLARLDADRVWIVDPLDGTWEYGQDRDDFAVHVALWTRGAGVSAATVDLPSQATTWSVLDDVPPPAPIPRDRPVRLVVSRSRRPARLDDTVARLSERLAAEGLTGRGVEVVQVGSVGAKAAELYAGRAEVYLHDSGFHDWDLAAPLGVARHLGLWCSSPDGAELVFNNPSTVQPGIVMCAPAVAGAVRHVQGL